MITRKYAALFLINVFLVACGGESNSPADHSLSSNPTSRYDMAGGCYALQSAVNERFIVADDNGGYLAQAPEADEAEAFYMKATALGQYLFYGTTSRVMASKASSVTSSQDINDAAVWAVEATQSNGQFSVLSADSGKALALNNAGELMLAAVAEGGDDFRFIPTRKPCASYPEMPLGITGPSYKGQGIDKPVIGFADVHAHLGIAHEMSADDSVGPSAGGSFYGQPFHRFGVAHALGDCADFHGPNGILDANNIIHFSPLATHDTQGWPTFNDWPAPQQMTHQAAYYRWIERNYRAGLRIIVSYGTNIKGLCDASKVYTLRLDADCNDHSVAMKQNAYVLEMQDYIDAQSGGPGKGWFRVVYSPQQAREVINNGKLAVVLGLEASQLFDCGVTNLPGGISVPHCNAESFDEKLNEAYARGIRQVVPLHDTDNAFAGAGILNGQPDTMNIFNFLDTKSFFKTIDCPDGGEEGYLHPGGSYFATGIPLVGNDPLTNLLGGVLQGPLPLYPGGERQCNSRPLQDLGRYAFQRFKEKGMIVSIDHAPLLVKRTLLDWAKEQNPPFPLISGHGYQGGVTNEDVRDLFKSGGYSYPYKSHGADFVELMAKVRKLHTDAEYEDPSRVLPFAFGIGMDVNGFGGYNEPRDDASQRVNYPFKLFEGDGWGPQFAAAGIQAVTVEQLQITNGKSWDTEVDGTAHYGLIADFIEEVRLEGGEQAIDALFNSAEAYLQLWESVYKEP